MEETNKAETETPIPQSNVAQSLVLVVEDSAIQAKLLERILLGAGYRVAVARDGAEGLVKAQQEKPVLIISDINMPVMNGLELCHAIKSDMKLRHIPVILLTMLTDVGDVIMAMNAGADSYISKPYDQARLLALLHSMIENYIPQHGVEKSKVEVMLGGKSYSVFSSIQHILNMLLYIDWVPING